MESKLGPCPLCGGEAMRDSHECWCKDGRCSMNFSRQGFHAWSRLSALAASEKRMREALERCRDEFMHRDSGRGYMESNGDMIAECKEALKGGKV